MLPDQEMLAIQRLARRERLTVGEWVRRALREVREKRPVNDPETKLRAIRRAAEYSFPTGDIRSDARGNRQRIPELIFIDSNIPMY